MITREVNVVPMNFDELALILCQTYLDSRTCWLEKPQALYNPLNPEPLNPIVPLK